MAIVSCVFGQECKDSNKNGTPATNQDDDRLDPGKSRNDSIPRLSVVLETNSRSDYLLVQHRNSNTGEATAYDDKFCANFPIDGGFTTDTTSTYMTRL